MLFSSLDDNNTNQKQEKILQGLNNLTNYAKHSTPTQHTTELLSTD